MIKVNEVILNMTCGACPEQYDALLDDEIIGYLRLRHGYFYAAYPDASGEIVYEAETKGDGIFDIQERSYHLEQAKTALLVAHLKLLLNI